MDGGAWWERGRSWCFRSNKVTTRPRDSLKAHSIAACLLQLDCHHSCLSAQAYPAVKMNVTKSKHRNCNPIPRYHGRVHAPLSQSFNELVSDEPSTTSDSKGYMITKMLCPILNASVYGHEDGAAGCWDRRVLCGRSRQPIIPLTETL